MAVKAGINNLRQDLHYTIRSLRMNPGFFAVAVLTLALGIGANSAIFSLVYAAVLRPLGFARANQLAFVSTGKLRTGQFNSGASGAELEEWKPQLQRLFDDFATVSGTHVSTWSAAREGVHLTVRDVSDNFFSLLGVNPFVGRNFTANDTAAGHGDIVIVSYNFWQEHLGGDFHALGQTLREKGSEYPAYTVIGILPPDFAFDESTDIWKPQQPLPGYLMNMRTVRRFRVVGRVRPEISLAQAQAAMSALAAQEARAYPSSNRDWAIRVASLRQHFQANGHLALWLLWAAAGCLLLIACTNAANLLLARSAARESEIAMRLALGCSRGRLAVQLLTESGVLALFGGVSGCIMAAWAFRLLRFWGTFLLPASTLQDLVLVRPDALDPVVLAFTLAASAGAVLLFGLAPMWCSARMELNHVMRTSSGNQHTSRIGISRFLIVAEVAVIMILVMSAGLLVHSFIRLTAVDPGFRAGNRITFDIELPSASAVSRPSAEESRRRFQSQIFWFMELENRLRSIPGIAEVGASNAFPLTDESGGWGVTIDGKQLPESTSMAHVSPGYFDAVSAPVVEGSNFSQDAGLVFGSKPLIVNQTMAHLLFPGGSAVGKHVNAPRCGIVSSSSAQPSDCLIVGIARDTRFSLDAPPPPTFYYSLYQDAGDRVTYVARANHDPAQLVPMVRAVVAGMPPIHSGQAYLFQLQTMDQLVARSVASPRFRSWLVSVFAGLALLLAVVGIYGVQAYAVSRRTQEIGIRMALGARPAALFAMILGDAAGWTLLGAVIGLAAGLVATRWMAGFLFGVSRWDPVTLIASPLVLIGVALIGSYLPARRAMRVDPIAALRP